MSAKQAKRSLKAQDIDVSSFLRSINLCFDAAHPERIEHFRPTAKCVRLLTALSGQESDRAFFVVAPYGTGKSIAASYLLQLIENRPDADAVLRTIEDRMQNVNSAFAEFAGSRRRRKKRGIAIALQGYCPSLPTAIQEAIGESMDRLRLGRQARPIMSQGAQSTEDIIAMLKTLLSKAEQEKCDRVVLIWDEFGRHLESLVAEGRTSQLNDIQTIAEFASRSTKVSLTIGLILHQDLFNYASNLPQSVRSEWKKIEGRFQSLQYVDLSRETYSLIADLVAARRTQVAPDASYIKKVARTLKEAGLYADFSQKDLAELLERSYPLEPAALWALPRIAARVAQNERTLFSFLGTVDLREPITPATVFDYFSNLMQADMGVGGTYKKWLETQTAIERASDIEGGADALKTIAVMGFNVSNQRGMVSSGLADLSLAGYTRQEQATNVRRCLLERKLLLHRKHSDEVSIWHGADIDLRGILEDEKNRQRLTFDLFGFLRKEAPLSVWRPTRYNDEYRMQRYFRCSYVSHQDLHSYLGDNLSAKVIADTCDGLVLYYVPESPEQLAEAEAIVRTSLRHNRVLIALPRQVTALKEACLEVWSLVSLQGNQELVGSDPLVLPELRQMTDDARAHLDRLAQALTNPRVDGPRWYHIGDEHQIDTPRALRSLLSSIMEDVYCLTPKLNNEAIVRQRPSGAMVNSRKKLEIGILERSGAAKMGIEGDFPDASMFFTILLDTGIYRQAKAGMYRYARPQEIEDPGLRRIWSMLEDFFVTPLAAPKSFETLLIELARPPIGIRSGVVPILIAAAFRAFPSAFILSHRNRGYISDIRPSDIEDLCDRPHLYSIQVRGIDAHTRKLLKGITDMFGDPATREIETDALRAAWDSIREWYSGLSEGARSSAMVSADASALRRAIAASSSPADLLFQALPEILGIGAKKPDVALKRLEILREELENMTGAFRARASEITRQCFGAELSMTSEQDAARKWAGCFPTEFTQHLSDRYEKGIFKRIAVDYTSSDKFIDAISVLLDCGTVEKWSDASVADFERRLMNLVASLEDKAVASWGHLFPEMDSREQFADLFVDRINVLTAKLTRIVGPKRARAHLTSVVAKLNKET